MIRIRYFVLIFLLLMIFPCFAQEKALLIDDFEDTISGGPDGTIDFGAGNGSLIEVGAATDIKYLGKQSLKLTYKAVAGGYMWVARGVELDAKNANWLVNPEGIDWIKYKALSFYVYGSDSKAKISFDIKDKDSEMWRFNFEDNFKGWKRISCAFDDFFARDDWQPDGADKNMILDFPLKSYQFEPMPEAGGILYLDDVELLEE